METQVMIFDRDPTRPGRSVQLQDLCFTLQSYNKNYDGCADT